MLKIKKNSVLIKNCLFNIFSLHEHIYLCCSLPFYYSIQKFNARFIFNTLTYMLPIKYRCKQKIRVKRLEESSTNNFSHISQHVILPFLFLKYKQKTKNPSQMNQIPFGILKFSNEIICGTHIFLPILFWNQHW